VLNDVFKARSAAGLLMHNAQASQADRSAQSMQPIIRHVDHHYYSYDAQPVHSA
jgi:hypothetical protein